MRIHYQIIPTQKEVELLVKAPDETQAQAVVQQLNHLTKPKTLSVLRNERQYFLAVTEILFIETEAGHLAIHTRNSSYQSNQRLYQLAELLPDNFLQISKSAIVNLNEIAATTRSISSCLISFYQSHKEIYASRRYYHQLQIKLAERRSFPNA